MERPLRQHRTNNELHTTARKRVLRLLGLFGHSDKVLIVICPDPDSMASAMAVKRLLWKQVNKVFIAHTGEIRRLDNLAMVELLKIPLVPLVSMDSEAITHRL